jgi:hypothetical protein
MYARRHEYTAGAGQDISYVEFVLSIDGEKNVMKEAMRADGVNDKR